jgi:hypothetical protein
MQDASGDKADDAGKDDVVLMCHASEHILATHAERGYYMIGTIIRPSATLNAPVVEARRGGVNGAPSLQRGRTCGLA